MRIWWRWRSSGGREPMLLAIDPDGRYLVCFVTRGLSRFSKLERVAVVFGRELPQFLNCGWEYVAEDPLPHLYPPQQPKEDDAA